MKQSRLTSYRLRLFIIPCLICAVTGIVGTLILENHLKKWMLTQFKNELTWQAKSTSEFMHNIHDLSFDIPSINKITDQLGDISPTRFTVIDQEGVVLGDSELRYEEVVLVENHADRPEVIAAFEKGSGSSIRYSSTIGTDMLYIAVLHIQNNQPTVVRTAVALSDIDENVIKIRSTLGFIAIITLLIIASLAWFMSRFSAKSLEREHIRLEQRVSERTHEITLLQELSNMLATTNNLDEAKLIVSNIAEKLLPNSQGALSLIKSSRNLCEIIVTWGVDWPGDRVFLPSACWSLRKGQIHQLKKEGMNLTCEHYDTTQQNSEINSLCIPMQAHGETIGALHILKPQGIRFTEQEIDLASTLSRQVSLAISNIKLRLVLENQAVRDSLTGLYNRRYLEDILERELQRSTRHQHHFSILMIDVDHFKELNDAYGHDSGDYVLKAISSTFQNSTRKEDVACRYGGEEFILVLSDSNIDGALKRAEQIRGDINNNNFICNSVALPRVTISVGVATFPQHGDNVAELIRASDSALYQAKNSGRNQVVSASASIAFQ